MEKYLFFIEYLELLNQPVLQIPCPLPPIQHPYYPSPLPFRLPFPLSPYSSHLPLSPSPSLTLRTLYNIPPLPCPLPSPPPQPPSLSPLHSPLPPSHPPPSLSPLFHPLPPATASFSYVESKPIDYIWTAAYSYYWVQVLGILISETFED